MLLAVAVWDTLENSRSWMTEATLRSLAGTVDWGRHRLFISDNGSCGETLELYKKLHRDKVLPFTVLHSDVNLGTAVAINKAWKYRKPGEHALKADNDVVIHQSGWADLMEFIFEREQGVGIIGLKRKDLDERPDHEEPHYRSTLRMVKHVAGEPWVVVEECIHVMGTCQAYSDALLKKVGYLYQAQDEGNRYGFDDSLSSLRASLAGFRRVFLHGIEIDHIDPGGTEYTEWKRRVSGQWMRRYNEIVQEYRSGKRHLYYAGE